MYFKALSFKNAKKKLRDCYPMTNPNEMGDTRNFGLIFLIVLLIPLLVLTMVVFYLGQLWFLMLGLGIAIGIQPAYYLRGRLKHRYLPIIYTIVCVAIGMTIYNFLQFIWIPIDIRPLSAFLFGTFVFLSFVEISLLYLKILPWSPFQNMKET
jgi:hypothetical protein